MAAIKSTGGPFLGRIGWLAHRIVASYWSLPISGVIVALPVVFAILYLDRGGLSDWLLGIGFDPVANADTAREVVGVSVGINAAFITLYFSLTLLVLTVASSNLGVRLVDRWLEKKLVRVSLAGLSFTLIFSLAAMAAIDAEAPKSEVPIALVASVIVLQAVNVAMLTVALHDLGRTIFVDRSIETLGNDASAGPFSVASAPIIDTQWARTVRSPREGYVIGNDLELLQRRLDGTGGRVRICAAPGQHVLKGETLLLVERSTSDDITDDKLLDALPVGGFRSDGQGAVFRIRLLVEIAARALSPAVNDFYTALTAGDRLAAVILAQRSNWVDEECMPVFVDNHDYELPGQDFRGLFEDPLAAFRQAACQYPSVAIRMIDNYARIHAIVLAEGQSDEFAEFLCYLARQLRDHAASVTDFDGDRQDIMDAFAKGFTGEDAGNEGAGR